jgi:hypothetical protein
VSGSDGKKLKVSTVVLGFIEKADSVVKMLLFRFLTSTGNKMFSPD